MATLLCAFAIHASAEGRRVESFNYGWRFVLENVAGAEQPQFDDSQWRTVNVPHDFQIEQPWFQGDGNWLVPQDLYSRCQLERKARCTRFRRYHVCR